MRRAEAQPPIKSFARRMLVHMLPKAAQIERFSAKLCLVDVQVPVFKCMAHQEQAVDDAGFPDAVSPVNKGKRANRKTLRVTEGFEVSDPESAQSISSGGHFRMSSWVPAIQLLLRWFGRVAATSRGA